MSEAKNKLMNQVLVSLGSNIQPETNLTAAIDLLSAKVASLDLSSIWESPAVGSSGPNYLNCAALIQSDLSLAEIKDQVLRPIENQLGRVRSTDKYMDRTIDLDVLLYNEEVLDPELWTQAHLALPGSELLPTLKEQDSGRTLLEAALQLQGAVNIFKRTDLA